MDYALDMYDDEFDDYDDYDDMDAYDEDDEFLSQLSALWSRVPKQQQQWAKSAAKMALTTGGSQLGGYIGNRLGGSWGKTAGGTLGYGLGSALGNLIPEDEMAAMDYLAEMAVQTEDDDEAEAFIGALIPLAAKLLPQAAGVVSKVAPKLIAGASKVASTLRRNPAARRMIRSLPGIVRNTTRDVARHYARTGQVSGNTAARYLARRTQQGLSKPGAAAPRAPAQARRRAAAATRSGYRSSRVIRGQRGYCRCYYR